MIKVRWKVALFAAVALVASSSATLVSAEPLGDHVASLRRTVGLTSDARDINRFRTNHTFLSSSERSALARQVSLARETRHHLRSLSTRDEFAGWYVEHGRHGRITVLTTGSVSAWQKDVDAMLDGISHVDVRVLPATHSLKSWKWVKTLLNNAPDLRHTGVAISFDVKRNRLTAMVRPSTPQAVTTLLSRYGIEVVESKTGLEAVSREDSYPQMKAGLVMANDPTPGDNHRCTAGFAAYSNDRASFSGKHYWILTAGHCYPVGDWYLGWSGQTGDNLGELDIANQSGTDSGAMDMHVPSDRSNELYVDDGDIRHVIGSQDAGDDMVGDLVCMSADSATYGEVCGEILDTDYDYYPEEGDPILDLRQADFPASEGDSGAPIYDELPAHAGYHAAIGIMDYSGPADTSYYSHIDNALDDLLLDGVLTYDNEALTDGAGPLYRLGETQVADDLTSNSLNATYSNVDSGGTTAAWSGGHSAYFKGGGDGGSYVSRASNSSIVYTGSFSIELWVKTPSSVGNYGLVHKEGSVLNSKSGNYRLSLVNSSGSQKVEFGYEYVNGGSCAGASERKLTSTGTLNASTWYHIVAVRDSGSGMKIYINGSASGSNGSTETPCTGSGSLDIGKRADGVYLTSGYLDEVAIYGSALSSGQASTHYAAAGSGYWSTVASDSPSVYYRLDEAHYLLDSSSTALNGTYTRTALDESGAIVGDTAAGFDGGGGSQATVADDNALDHTGDFTVEAWIKAGYNDVTHRWILAKGDSLNYRGNYSLEQYNGDIYFGVQTGTTSYIYNQCSIDAVDARGVVGEWYHVVGVYKDEDASGLKMYIDGTLQTGGHCSAQSTVSVTPVTNAGSLHIGGNGSLRFGGVLDEVAIYPDDLTSTQIQAHYFSGSYF